MDVYCYKIVRIGSVEYFRSEGLSNRAASGAVSARSRADEWLEETLRTSLSLGSEGLSNRAASGAVSARSRADEWLEETLRTSLSLGSPLKTINAQFNSGVSSELGPPPEHPPPPLPPNVTSSTVNQTLYDHQQEIASVAAKFDSDFSRYQLPPITEGFTPTAETLTSHEDIDVFGQPVFNPMPTGCAPNKLVHDRTEHSNGTTNGFGTQDADPFDVKWSELAVTSSSSFNQTPVKSTNPFYNESSAVRI
uniref:Clathrin assembly protein n=1 Tax=Ascaris lumbricoides TaxID=6252 RepID=A0A0M3ITW0_ASCLU